MYATQQDMIDRYGSDELIQLTDRSNGGAIDATVLDAVLTDASAEMDGYLGARYSLPLTTTPPALVPICCQIARYFLYDDAAPDMVKARYQDSVTFLQNLSKGIVQLGIDSSDVEPASSDGAQISSGGRVFSRDDKSFI